MCYPPLYAQVVAWCLAHSGFFINIHKSHWINKIEALKTFLAECWKFHFYLVSGRDEWSFSVKTFQLDVNITAKTDLPAIPLWTRNMKRAPQGIKFQTDHQYGPLGNILEFPHFLIALFITVILSVSHIGGSSQQAMLSPEPTLISSFQPLSPVWLFVTPWHARPHCPWPTPRVYSNSCPLSRWCHPTISSSVFPFSSRLCPLIKMQVTWVTRTSALTGARGQILESKIAPENSKTPLSHTNPALGIGWKAPRVKCTISSEATSKLLQSIHKITHCTPAPLVFTT